MTGRPATFKQHDVTRAIKAVQAAGIAVGRVEISPTGKIIVFSGGAEPDDVDTELEEFRRTSSWLKSK